MKPDKHFSNYIQQKLGLQNQMLYHHTTDIISFIIIFRITNFKHFIEPILMKCACPEADL